MICAGRQGSANHDAYLGCTAALVLVFPAETRIAGIHRLYDGRRWRQRRGDGRHGTLTASWAPLLKEAAVIEFSMGTVSGIATVRGRVNLYPRGERMISTSVRQRDAT